MGAIAASCAVHYIVTIKRKFSYEIVASRIFLFVDLPGKFIVVKIVLLKQKAKAHSILHVNI
jgi:hypothetical protein